jgi:signal transduction histidine kinase
MPIPTSPEFVALCQSQLALLTQGLGASMGVVYWSEGGIEGAEPQLVPIAAAPDYLMGQAPGRLSALRALTSPERPPSERLFTEWPPSQAFRGIAAGSEVGEQTWQAWEVDRSGRRSEIPEVVPLLMPDRLVLPLMHEGMVLGLLVTERPDRHWSEPEQIQVNRVAQTLALASVLDQRAQWLEQSQQQQRVIQAEQQELMGTLLHQFRNPLTALRTFGKLLTRRLSAPDPNQAVATSMVRETDRLQELLLQFDRAIVPPALLAGTDAAPIGLLPASIFSGELSLAPCDLAAVLAPLLDSAGAVAQERGLALHSELPTPLPAIVANGAALREVLSNLLDNALKYTPPGGQVHVRVIDGPDRLWIGVTDNGHGIPDGDLPRLFERHFRGAAAQTAIPGTGLGLAIARHLMAQMQGDLEAFSPLLPLGWIGSDRPDQRGTTFGVTLPRSAE